MINNTETPVKSFADVTLSFSITNHVKTINSLKRLMCLDKLPVVDNQSAMNVYRSPTKMAKKISPI